MKPVHALALGAAALACLTVSAHTALAQRPAQRQAWEYKVVPVPPQTSDFAPMLNREGADGWELVTGGSNFYFKRPR